MQAKRTKEGESGPKRIPWREGLSFVFTYYSILTAMVGAILALAIGDKEISNRWYWPVGLLSLSMFSFIWGLEKCGDAMDENDVDKYLAWLLAYNSGTVLMFFGISTYVVIHYRPPWPVLWVVQILAIAASSKWLYDIKYLLSKGEAEYQAYREELLGNCEPDKDPDWLMRRLAFFRGLHRRKDA